MPWGCGGKGTLVHYWWKCKLVLPLWKTVGEEPWKTNTTTILILQYYNIWSSSFPPGYISRKNQNTNLKRYIQSQCSHSSIYHSQGMEAIQVSINRQIDKEDVVYIQIHTHTNGILLSHKKNTILPFAAMWVGLQNTVLSEVSRTQKDKHYMTSLIWRAKKQNKWMNLGKKEKQTDGYRKQTSGCQWGGTR